MRFEFSERLISNESKVLEKTHHILDEAVNDMDFGIILYSVTVILEDAMQTIIELTGENVFGEIISKFF